MYLVVSFDFRLSFLYDETLLFIVQVMLRRSATCSGLLTPAVCVDRETLGRERERHSQKPPTLALVSTLRLSMKLRKAVWCTCMLQL
jgi:hypothetical protein